MDGNANVIIEQILDEAKVFSDRTVKAAEKEAERILSEARAEAAQKRDAVMAEAQAELAARKERLISAAQMDAKKQLLGVKQELIAQAIDRAAQQLTALDDSAYLELIETMLYRAIADNADVSDTFEVIVSEAEKSRISDAFVAGFNSRLETLELPFLKEPAAFLQRLLAKVVSSNADRTAGAFVSGIDRKISGVKVVLSGQTREIGAGFLLKAGDIEVNCTFDAIIRGMREELQAEVARILFA